MKIYIFTDGSSRGNPGPGGWGSVVVVCRDQSTNDGEGQVIELGGREDHTTNNRMELTAAAKGVQEAGRKDDGEGEFIVYTDSSYVINGITKWIYGWKRNGWITKAGQEVLNKDLWMALSDAIGSHRVEWKYVGGHVGIAGNERCDRIATSFADENDPALYRGPLAGYDLPKILDISHDESKVAEKSSSSNRSKAKAYSYVSSVGGVIKVHQTWAECEKRVKGVKGAKFKKALSAEDEAKIISQV